MIKQHPHLVLIVTPDAPQAHRLEHEIRYFCPDYRDSIMVFPDWETLPYDNFSPHQDIISERLSVLARLPQTQRGALIVSLNTLLHRIAPTDYISGQALQLSAGQQLDIHALRSRLERAGYRAVNQVMEHGEFCARGSLLDVFPMGSLSPFRIDFFDTDIDSIRTFDPDTQLSADPIPEINLLPAHEFPTTPTAIEGFRARFREQFDAPSARESIYQQVSQGNSRVALNITSHCFLSTRPPYLIIYRTMRCWLRLATCKVALSSSGTTLITVTSNAGTTLSGHY